MLTVSLGGVALTKHIHVATPATLVTAPPAGEQVTDSGGSTAGPGKQNEGGSDMSAARMNGVQPLGWHALSGPHTGSTGRHAPLMLAPANGVKPRL